MGSTGTVSTAGWLATPEQKRMEQRAMELITTPPVREAMAATLALFQADPNARLPNQEHLMRQSVDEHYFHACLMAASETPRSPCIVWSLMLDHDWMGLRVPGSRFGQDNTDNCYRIASVDDSMSYRITGRFAAVRPSDFSICALPAQIGDHILADVLDIIPIDGIDVDADGCFSITLDATPRNGRRNHLCIAGAKTLHVRDTLVDWACEMPSALRIERTDGPTIDDFDPEKAAIRAARLGGTIASYFLDKVQHGMFESRPVNTIESPLPSAGRGGLVTQTAAVGHYDLAADEAMLITANVQGARYLGIQIVDMWMISYDYRDHVSSMNQGQAVTDADGRIRWVISAADPGVYNWLDGSGHGRGCVLMRWQCLPQGADFNDLVSTRIVKLADLKQCLPAGTRFVDAAGRAAQRAERRRDYQNRIA